MIRPPVHHRHAVGHGQNLALVVGDLEKGDAGAGLDLFQFGAHVPAQLQVQGRERLVEQEH